MMFYCLALTCPLEVFVIPRNIYSYPSRFLGSGWALLLACICKVLPPGLAECGVDLRIIAFINEVPVIREILGHLSAPTWQRNPRIDRAWEAVTTGRSSPIGAAKIAITRIGLQKSMAHFCEPQLSPLLD